MDKPIKTIERVIKPVLVEKTTLNIPNSLFLELVNKEGIPVPRPIKFIVHCIKIKLPTVISVALIIAAYVHANKNRNPKIEKTKEVILKLE